MSPARRGLARPLPPRAPRRRAPRSRHFESTAERAVTHGRGEGGDTALAVDRAAEDAVFAELEAFGRPLLAVSEERGEVPLAGGGDGARGDRPGRRLDERQARAAVRVRLDRRGRRAGDGRRGGGLRGRARTRPRDWWAVRGGGAWLRRRAPGAARARAARGARPRDRAPRAGGAAADAHRRRARPAACARSARWPLSMCLVAAGRSTRWSPCARSARSTWRRRS